MEGVGDLRWSFSFFCGFLDKFIPFDFLDVSSIESFVGIDNFILIYFLRILFFLDLDLLAKTVKLMRIALLDDNLYQVSSRELFFSQNWNILDCDFFFVTQIQRWSDPFSQLLYKESKVIEILSLGVVAFDFTGLVFCSYENCPAFGVKQ